MAFSRLYETDTFTVYPGDVRTLKLSFAIWLIDDYTKEKPIGRIRVELENKDKKVFRNLSGYYCFTGLETGNYIVSIKSEFYFPEKITVDMPAFSDPNNPVVEVNGKPEIALKPNPGYPFPTSATIVRGLIKSGSGKSIADLRVRVKGKDIENLTDSRGEFVLYFENIVKKEKVALIINEETNEYSITVKEGKTVFAKNIWIQ